MACKFLLVCPWYQKRNPIFAQQKQIAIKNTILFWVQLTSTTFERLICKWSGQKDKIDCPSDNWFCDRFFKIVSCRKKCVALTKKCIHLRSTSASQCISLTWAKFACRYLLNKNRHLHQVFFGLFGIAPTDDDGKSYRYRMMFYFLCLSLKEFVIFIFKIHATLQ